MAVREPDLAEAEDEFLRLYLQRDLATALAENAAQDLRQLPHSATRIWALLPASSRRRLLAVRHLLEREGQARRLSLNHEMQIADLRSELANARYESAELIKIVDAVAEALSTTITWIGRLSAVMAVALIADVVPVELYSSIAGAGALVSVLVLPLLLAAVRAGVPASILFQIVWPLAAVPLVAVLAAG